MTSDIEIEQILPLLELEYRDPELHLKAIAQILRGPDIDPRFLELLADYIDPDKKGPETKVKLVVGRKAGAGAPEKSIDAALILFLEVHIDFFGQKAEAVFAEAKNRLGAGRTKCAEALKEIRQYRKRHPETFEEEKKFAISGRAAGDPFYQPLWTDE